MHPKPAFRNPEGYKQIDEELYRISQNRLCYVQQIEDSGITKYVYKRSGHIKPESDMGWQAYIKMKSYRKNLLFLVIENIKKDIHDEFVRFLQKFFQDSYGRRQIFITGSESGSGDEITRKLLKKKGHQRYNTPHKQAESSPIEKIFREELQRRNVIFEEQVEFVLDGKKFSVPDFVIRPAKLLIYCDGTEFHKNPQRIIMDKQQDRALQAKGFTVFRFSGSEIASNISACVDEVVWYVKKVVNDADAVVNGS
jgi:very-short-patch-repair endonuclease